MVLRVLFRLLPTAVSLFLSNKWQNTTLVQQYLPSINLSLVLLLKIVILKLLVSSLGT